MRAKRRLIVASILVSSSAVNDKSVTVCVRSSYLGSCMHRALRKRDFEFTISTKQRQLWSVPRAVYVIFLISNRIQKTRAYSNNKNRFFNFKEFSWRSIHIRIFLEDFSKTNFFWKQTTLWHFSECDNFLSRRKCSTLSFCKKSWRKISLEILKDTFLSNFQVSIICIVYLVIAYTLAAWSFLSPTRRPIFVRLPSVTGPQQFATYSTFRSLGYNLLSLTSVTSHSIPHPEPPRACLSLPLLRRLTRQGCTRTPTQ